MLKPAPLHVGDHVAVVSLSSGTLGELTQQHQLNRGLKRMRQLGSSHDAECFERATDFTATP